MDLKAQIVQRARPLRAPNQKSYSTLSLADRDAIAASCSISKKAVEIAALENGVIPQRYMRNIGSLGIEGQKKLLGSRVFLAGAGGLGGTIAQLLARMGVGTLVIADGDSFSEDNLNRQALAFEGNLGSPKTKMALENLKQINGATEVETFHGFAGYEEFSRLLRGSQVAIDALDNLPSRFKLEEACKEAKIPLVHGAVAGFSGQLTVIFPEDIGFRAFYGEPQTAGEKGIEVELGNLAGIVSTIASLEVQEAVKIITNVGRPLRNRLLFIDTFNGTAEIIHLQ